MLAAIINVWKESLEERTPCLKRSTTSTRASNASVCITSVETREQSEQISFTSPYSVCLQKGRPPFPLPSTLARVSHSPALALPPHDRLKRHPPCSHASSFVHTCVWHPHLRQSHRKGRIHRARADALRVAITHTHLQEAGRRDRHNAPPGDCVPLRQSLLQRVCGVRCAVADDDRSWRRPSTFSATSAASFRT